MARNEGAFRTLSSEVREGGFDLEDFFMICRTCQGNITVDPSPEPPTVYVLSGLLSSGERGRAAVTFLHDGTVMIPYIWRY